MRSVWHAAKRTFELAQRGALLHAGADRKPCRLQQNSLRHNLQLYVKPEPLDGSGHNVHRQTHALRRSEHQRCVRRDPAVQRVLPTTASRSQPALLMDERTGALRVCRQLLTCGLHA